MDNCDFHYQNTVYQIVGNTYNPLTFDSTSVSRFFPEIHIDHQKRLWLIALSGLYYLSGQKFESFAPKQGLSFVHLGGSRKPLWAEDKTGQIWIGTSQGLGLIRPGNHDVELLPEDHPLHRVNITSMMTDNSGQLWVGTENGLYYINPSHVKVYSLSADFLEKRISAVAVGKDNSYFIGGNSGEIFNIKDDRIVKQKSLGLEPFQLFVDNKGSLWKLSAFGNYQVRDNELKSFAPQSILRNIIEDKEGNFYFAENRQGIGKLDNNFQYKLLDLPKVNFRNKTLSSLYRFKSGEWILGTYNSGLILIDTLGYPTYIYDTMGFPAAHAFAISADQKNEGGVWISTNAGLVYYLNKNFTVINQKHGLQESSVFSVVQDQTDHLWLTSNQGIMRISRLQCEEIIAGRRQKLNCIIFDEADGLLTRQCTGARHAILSRDGKILVPTLDGLVEIDPHNLHLDEQVAPPVLHTFEFNEQKKSLEKEWSLAPGNNRYNFKFTALNYVAPHKIRFKYKLEGYDKDWSESSQVRQANYTNLLHGHYTFRVVAINPDGIQHEQEDQFYFKVRPRIYETWWFKLLAFGGLIIGLMGFIRWRVRSSERKNKQLEEKIKTRTEDLRQANKFLSQQKGELEQTLTALKNTQTQLIHAEKMASLGELTAGIAHEIQNPLNFVNNFSEVNAELTDELLEAAQKEQLDEVKNLAQDIKQNQEKIALHGRRADAIVKNMLQHSRSNTGTKEPIDINALCEEYLRLSYHGLRAKDTSFNAKYRTELDPAVGMVNINAQDMGRVVLNVLNNAFYAVNQKAKHNAAGYEPEVIIRTRQTPEHTIIKVEDNGGGIPEDLRTKIFQPFFTTKPTGEGTGLGLSLAYEIVTKGHGGRLEVDSLSDNQTEFRIVLPAIQSS